MNRRLMFGFLLSVLLVGGKLGAQVPSSIKVIAHLSVSVSSLTVDQVTKLFLKKTTRWADGSAAVPVDQAEGGEVREVFSKAVHGRSGAAVKSYWQQQFFSGRGLPPPEKGSDAEVIAFVKANPGAIGYVSSGASTEGVKVIAVQP